jgi:hypothetical protein
MLEQTIIVAAAIFSVLAVLGVLTVAWILLWDGVAVFRRNIPNDND